ncbi:unnamed protein product [Symbiodinium microadriaticum]|nr:unnamed protein product [Symbiodinium microadriaticum]CAE7666452.1 unnamed protein product [Symbiodinium sp. KB8]
MLQLKVISAAMALSLHGCSNGSGSDSSDTTASGCNVAVGQACVTAYQSAIEAAGTDTAGTCAAVAAYVNCVQDSDCCSDVGIKQGLDSVVDSMSQSVCTGDNAISATCT